MKPLLFALALVVVLSVGPSVPMEMCLGAQLAVVHATAVKLQERKLPDGEWCQRPASRMSTKAHACSCHKHDCADDDPDHVSAHTDRACLSYCTVKDCRCAVMDCL